MLQEVMDDYSRGRLSERFDGSRTSAKGKQHREKIGSYARSFRLDEARFRAGQPSSSRQPKPRENASSMEQVSEDALASPPVLRGKQLHWPSSIYGVYLKPVLEDDLKIKEPIGWHTLRQTLGTLMKANGEDVKTIQETLRHAIFKVTMDVYTQGRRKSG
jgi:hypothetical protein